MAEYTKEQSTVVALWLLALQFRDDPEARIGDVAPDVIAGIVNQLGPPHSSGSILLHTHGYCRLFKNRDIDKTVTRLQREIAKELCDAGVVSMVHDV